MKIKDLKFVHSLSSLINYRVRVEGRDGTITQVGDSYFDFSSSDGTCFKRYCVFSDKDKEKSFVFLDYLEEDRLYSSLFIPLVKFDLETKQKLNMYDYVYVLCRVERPGSGGFFGTITRQVEGCSIIVSHNKKEYSGGFDIFANQEYGKFGWGLGSCCEIRYVPEQIQAAPYIMKKVADCAQGDYIEYEGQRGYLNKKGNDESILCFDEKTKEFGWSAGDEKEKCLGRSFGWWISDHSVVDRKSVV